MGDLFAYWCLFVAAFGAATILPLQSGAVLVGLLLSGNYPAALLIAVASVGNVLGAVANWLLGIGIQRFKDKPWFPVSTERLAQAQGWYQRYGKWSLLGSWLSIIGDPITVIEGVLKEPFWIFLILVTIAKVSRYLVLTAITLSWMRSMWQFVIDIQRDVYLGFADHIKAFASGTGWSAFLAFLPMGIAFGAVHAMTPGHSKSVLATYLAGSSLGMLRGLLVSLALSFTHVTMSVVITLFSLPLVSIMFGGTGAGSSPILESVSRGLLGVIGVWMLWSALSREPHTHGDREGIVVGLSAGLIPCPLTLFVMTFAISRGVPEAGIMFAVVMMIGVALTLSSVALVAIFFRQQMVHLFETRPKLIFRLTRGLQAASGGVLVFLALHELWWRSRG